MVVSVNSTIIVDGMGLRMIVVLSGLVIVEPVRVLDPGSDGHVEIEFHLFYGVGRTGSSLFITG